MEIKKELASNQTVLLLVPGTEYNDISLDIVKQLSSGKVAYVTLNKTYDSLKELFGKNKVNVKNIIFVDGICKTFKHVPDQTEDCYFVTSPGALTELSITLRKLLEQGFEYIIFDSLTNLLVYQQKAPVAKFVSILVNMVKSSKTKAVFYALKLKEHESLIQKSGMFVDKIIDLSL